MSDEINSSDDMINSSAVIKRLAYLERCEGYAAEETDPEEAALLLDEDEREELTKLRELAEAGRGVYGWDSGVTLINADYFTEYAKDQAEDINGIDTSSWPFDHINWDEAADALKIDYTEIEWDGETFYVR